MPACKECGKPVEGKRSGAQFCTKEHKQTYLNRNIKRGNQIYPLVYRWRALRSVQPEASNEAFSRLCSILSNWIDLDRAADRAVPGMPDNLGIASAVVFKPPRVTEAQAAAADRKVNREFAIQERNHRTARQRKRRPKLTESEG